MKPAKIFGTFGIGTDISARNYSRINTITWLSQAAAIPMTNAKDVTISKYNKAFAPTLPAFLRSLMDAMPKVIVKNMMGLINNFMMEINKLLRNSANVVLISISVIKRFSLIGFSRMVINASFG